jgi:formate dehydrogenase subunit gamma
MLTGLVMTFHWMGAAAVGWAAALHFAAVGAVFAGLMVHVYMGAVFPEEKPAFFSMITGNVNELFAYSHHFKWWREVRGERAAAAPDQGRRENEP